MKSYLRKISHTNLKLWIILAIFPFAITGGVFLYGYYNFDGTMVQETDANTDNATLVEYIPIEEGPKNDFVAEVRQKMILPEQKAAPVKTTTKEDKRMLDSQGNMVTIEVPEDMTLEEMAEKHLGNKAFWVFFFDVNRDKLNKPSDLQAGMKLYVPNAEYFGFSVEDNASIEYAKRRANEIQSKQQQ